jgi:hypothetical protein
MIGFQKISRTGNCLAAKPPADARQLRVGWIELLAALGDGGRFLFEAHLEPICRGT